MRRLLALIGKEWRDARALTLGAAIAAVVLTAGANLLWLEWQQPLVTAVWVVPALLALYLLAVASDLVAADAASERTGTWALLPARPFALWSAKVIFLLLAGAGFYVWIVIVQTGLHTALGRTSEAQRIVGWLDESIVNVAIAFALAAAAAFFSTLIERGFPAAVAAVLVVGGIGYPLATIDWLAWDVPVGDLHVLLAATGIGVVFLLGSGCAFVLGKVHLGRRVRRAVIGVGTVVGLMAVSAGATARAVVDHLVLEPGHPEARIHAISASPDGKHLAVGVMKDGQQQYRVWILAVEDGRTSPIAGRFVTTAHPPWNEKGELHVLVHRREGRHDFVPDLHHWIDPATGEIERTRSEKQFAPDGPLTEGWARILNRGNDGWTVGWPERDIERDFPGPILVPPCSGFLIELSGSADDGCVVHDLAAERSRRLAQGEAWGDLSPDGRRLATATRVLDVGTGELLDGPRERASWVCWIQGRPDGRYLARHDWNGPVTRIHDLEKNRTVTVEGTGYPKHNVQVLPDDRIVVVRDERFIDLLDRDGRFLRRLYGPEGVR